MREMGLGSRVLRRRRGLRQTEEGAGRGGGLPRGRTPEGANTIVASRLFPYIELVT